MSRHDPKTMRTSGDGRVALAASEGIVPAVYKDSVGVDTWGVGVTAMAIGEEQFSTLNIAMPSDVDAVVQKALTLFPIVLKTFEGVVRDNVTSPLHQYEFDALVHFAYNVGGPNFRKSKLLQHINRGDYKTAGTSGFHGWLRPVEIRSRRDFESSLFLTGDYGSKSIPVYRTNGAKRLAGRLKAISHLDALAMLNPTTTPAERPVEHIASKGRADISESTTIQSAKQNNLATLVPTGAAIWGAFQAQETWMQVLVIGAVIGSAVFIYRNNQHVINERIEAWIGGRR